MKKLLVAMVMSAGVILGCTGSPGPEGPPGAAGTAGNDGLASLLLVTAEPAGENCSGGGQKIQVGVDDNRNSVLDAAEVDATQYLCNGANGSNGSNGTNGTNGTDGFTALVSLTAEPAGANCAAGGQRVDVGVDDDRNGTLDPAEIDSTRYLCNGADGSNGTNGANGLTSLVNVTVEPAGGNCATGGQRVDSGLDTNTNGTLEVGEILQTRYVCNGANGHNSLITLTTVAAGANCAAGGQRVDVGVDDNGNGTLDSAEIDQTSYICNGIVGLSAIVLTTPNPATVLNAPNDCYFYPNNLVNGFWHRYSNRLIVGHYNSNGYWSHVAGASGYPAAPNNDTGVRYARMVHVPDTATVVHAGTSQFASPANTVYLGTIDMAGTLSGFQAAVWSDGFTGNCNLVSASQREFLCYDGTAVRHYLTAMGSASLTLVKTVTLSPQPTNVCGAHCFGGTFGWDGTYYYFSDDGASSTGRLYNAYAATGVRVGQYTATGVGAIDSVYFDWSVGQYATHDGFGGRTGTNNYFWTGGSASDDSQCYVRSTTHALP